MLELKTIGSVASLFALGLGLGYLLLGRATPVETATVRETSASLARGLSSRPGANLGVTLRDEDLTPADPVGSLEKLLAERSDVIRAALAYDFIQRLDQAGLEQCLQTLTRRPQNEQQLALERMLLKKIAQADPARAAALAAANPNLHAAHVLEKEVFGTWLQQDPTAAWTWASQLHDPVGRNLLLTAALEEKVKKNPQATAAYILQLAGEGRNEAFLQKGATAFALGALAKNDRAALTDFLVKLPEGIVKVKTVNALADALKETDPHAAADLLTTGRKNSSSLQQLSEVMSAWAQKDPQAALAYADTLKGTALNSAVQGLVPILAKTDFRAAIDLATSSGDFFVQANLAGTLLDQLKITTASAALAEAATLPGGALRLSFQQNFARTLAKSNPAAVTDYLLKMPNPMEANRVAYSVTQNWDNSDHSGLVNWLQSLPAGDLRDTGMNVFMARNMESHPDEAMKMAVQVVDTRDRTEATQEVYATWLKKNPAAAQAWLATSPLDAATRKALQEGHP